MNRWIVRLGYLALAVATLGLSQVGFWTLESTDVLTLKSPITVKPSEVESDGIVLLYLNYCKNHNAPGIVEAKLVSDHSEIEIPWAKDSSKRGCVETQAPVGIPAQASTGSYRVVFTVDYDINPLKRGTEELVSEEFQVVNPKLQPGDAMPVVK